MPDTPATPGITGLGFFGAAGRDTSELAARLTAPAYAPPISVRSDPDAGTWAVSALPAVDLASAPGGGIAAHLHKRALRPARRAPDSAKAALLAAIEAWSMAGLPWSGEGRERFAIVAAAQNCGTPVIAAATERLRANGALADPYAVPHGLDSFSLSLVSEILELRGEGSVAGAAQASGHAALIAAARLIASGEADVALVLGVPQVLSPAEAAGYLTLGAFASHNDTGTGCRPFDAATDGFLPAEMAAAVVLEMPRSASARGATPLATIAGWSMLMHASAQPSPDLATESAVMRRAVARAGLAPSSIDLVCAHATGTPLGDRTEAAAIVAEFGGGPLINAPKGLIGHGLAAAGVAETVISVLALRDRIAHGNAGLERPSVMGPRYAGEAAVSMPIGAVLNTGFGFGGFNAAVVVTAVKP